MLFELFTSFQETKQELQVSYSRCLEKGCSCLWVKRKVWLFTGVDETYQSSLRPSAAPAALQFTDPDFLLFLLEIQKIEAVREL